MSNLGPTEQPDLNRAVNFWKTRIHSAQKLQSYVDHQKSKEEARSFYKGNLFSKSDMGNWDGDIVQANLFKKHVNFIVDAVYAQDPTIRVVTEAKVASDPRAQANATAVETHIKYVIKEEKIGQEIRRIWKDSYFGNLSTAKIDYDRKRGLWRAKWVAGMLICDPDAHGDLTRARWTAECVQLPRYRVWQDPTFDINARKEIQAKSSTGSTIEYGDNEKGRDLYTLWYVYTKEGLDPFNVDIENPQKEYLRLIVIAEDYDKFLLNQKDPTPWLDEDEFPYVIMRQDELPGEFIGPAPWELIKSAVLAFNWASSYHMSDMRKTASRPIGYDINKLPDTGPLFSRKAMVPIGVDGPVDDTVLRPLDIGAADKTIFESAQFFYELIDKLTGIDEIARGEEGRTKTATESEILQQNSSIILRGPTKALDEFQNDLVRKIALATLFYMPQFSLFVENGIVMTKMIQQVPIVDQMGMMQMQPQVMPVPAQLDPNQMMEYGAMPTGMGSSIIPNYQGEKYLVKGADYYHGDQVAMNWPTLPFEEIKCELSFTVEAGSTRLEKRVEKQKAALNLLQTIGAEYVQIGAWPQYYEIIAQVIKSFDVDNLDKILISKEEFVQKRMMAMMMMQQAASASDNANPSSVSESKNEGEKFPRSASMSDM